MDKNMDENRLLMNIRKGDQKAFERFFNLHYHPVCLYIQNYTRDKDSAQEIAQDIFVQFWIKREEILITTSAKSYLYRMAYNQFIMLKRKEGKESDLIDHLTYEALQEDHALSLKEIRQKNNQIKKSVEKLPERCQQILKMRMNGVSYKEIAAELNISIKTVESQMRIAYTRLREDLKDLFVLLIMLWPKK